MDEMPKKVLSRGFLGLKPDARKLALKFIFLAPIGTLGAGFLASTIYNDIYNSGLLSGSNFGGGIDVLIVFIQMFLRMLFGTIVATVVGFFWFRWIKSGFQSTTVIGRSMMLMGHLLMVAIYGGGLFGILMLNSIYGNPGYGSFIAFEVMFIVSGIIFLIVPIWLVWVLIYMIYKALRKMKNRYARQ